MCRLLMVPHLMKECACKRVTNNLEMGIKMISKTTCYPDMNYKFRTNGIPHRFYLNTWQRFQIWNVQSANLKIPKA